MELRAKAASLIRSYLNGEISSHDFADSFPRDKSDPALHAVEQRLWFHYDVVRTHRYQFPLDSPEGVLFRRCALFFDTELDYEWPDLSYHNLAHPIVGILSGQLFRFRAIQKAKSAGHYAVWPFIRKADFKDANAKFSLDGVIAREDLPGPPLDRARRVRLGFSIGISLLQTVFFVATFLCALWGVFGHSRWLLNALICFVIYLMLLAVGFLAQPSMGSAKIPTPD